MSDSQSKPSSDRNRLSGLLYPVGLIACAAGALLRLRLPEAGGWVLFAGGLVIILSHILTTRTTSDLGLRERRLRSMNFLGGALYLIAGGAAIEGGGIWLVFFIVGTVFTAYTVFTLDHLRRKRESNNDRS